MMELKLKLKLSRIKMITRKKRGIVTLQLPLFLIQSNGCLIVQLQHHQWDKQHH